VDGVLEAPNKLTAPEAERLRAQWDTAHAGKRGTAVLEGGITYKPVMMSNSDAQLLEGRTYYATEIARSYGIPAPLLGLPMGEGSSLTYANLADIKAQFAQFAVQPVTDMLEAQFSALLPSTQEALFLFGSLLRADINTRFSVYERALAAGLMTRNEARELEGLPAVPGGDAFPADSQPAPTGQDTQPTPAQQNQVNA
jgi:HK97 family phage portal protein